jgi:hypothetical protein
VEISLFKFPIQVRFKFSKLKIRSLEAIICPTNMGVSIWVLKGAYG